jgi:hypothetical protein
MVNFITTAVRTSNPAQNEHFFQRKALACLSLFLPSSIFFIHRIHLIAYIFEVKIKLA